MGLQELMRKVEQTLAEAGHELLNEAEYPIVGNKMPVLVVLAGRRAARLQWLLASLADVTNIGDALLVISHSFYDEAVNELVKRVDYCRVLQLYFPYSVQLFPNRFPGAELNRSRAAAIAAEEKQHWWWTTSFLFNHYTLLDHKLGLALFLQEDDYVAPDLLHMLKYAQRAFKYHHEAEVISLGRPVTEADYSLLTVAPWQPPFESGLAFNLTFFKKLQASASYFCQYNDASWSYSLLSAFASWPRGYVDMIASMSPRVVSTREYASGREGAEKARGVFTKIFPMRVRVAYIATGDGRVSHPQLVPHGAGGWEDARDTMLCLDPFLMTTEQKQQGWDLTFAGSDV
ncbi:alpha-1,6-mannosyl-glycoprotein 2-beta-N-acetylglucosaminyltransferase-like [Cydia pomonella]|uniref:alpha-1,6-mannosyl-glycoprotein 2-beta-N-acetylglucosaminyltransferase-like n=1 Tax=Cydia pomonella TaxID=82600 RepID=UPI002ADD6BD8|nr:alpha-1,6-mannosyl-glycoprotein 2-beta-N-acetylglucosaminyltransferase-like [Cydia pomonella]